MIRLVALFVLLVAVQAQREGRGIYGELEKMVSGLNQQLHQLQASARQDLSRLRPWAERVEQEVAPHVERVGDSIGGAIQSLFGSGEGGIIDRREDGSETTGSEEHDVPHGFDQLFEHLTGESLDPFRIFGIARKKWWEGPNVCVDRKIIEEDPEGKDENSGGSQLYMDMTMTSCRDGANYHECTTHVNSNGYKKTVVVRRQCCLGFKRGEGSKGECETAEVFSMEDTIKDLDGREFLELMKDGGLEDVLEEANVTILVPSDDAVEDFRHDLEELNSISSLDRLDGREYHVDDGLLERNRRSAGLTIVEAPNLQDIISNHVVNGVLGSADMHDEQILETRSQGSQIRITVYNTHPEKVVMANCARITSSDHYATSGGMAHKVDRMILPAKRTLADIIAADAKFTKLADVLARSGLMDQLADESQHLTFFAPTDSAFDALDDESRERLMRGQGCSRDILMNHLLPNVICSDVVKSKARTINALDKHLILERNEDDELLVEDARVTITDVLGTNGILHVIDSVLIPETARSVDDALKASGADTLRDLLQEAGLNEDEEFNNATLFAPSEKALKALPDQLMTEIKADPQKLKDILLFHVASPKTCKCDFVNNKLLDTGVAGKKIRINVYATTPMNLFDLRPRQIATAQCAKLTALDDETCGGMIHTVEKVLLPPGGDVIRIMEDSGKFKKFLQLIRVAGLDEELKSGEDGAAVTILAPVDSAFDYLSVGLTERVFSNAEEASELVKRHLVPSMVCCAGVPRQMPFLDASGHRTRQGDVVSLRRSAAAHIYADRAEVTHCDMVADNGVVHAIDRVLIPNSLVHQDVIQEDSDILSDRNDGTLEIPFDIFKLF